MPIDKDIEAMLQQLKALELSIAKLQITISSAEKQRLILMDTFNHGVLTIGILLAIQTGCLITDLLIK